MSGQWAGRSLAFIRMATSQPAQYASAFDAAAASDFQKGEPEIGGYCWYMTRTPYGNVSLYLGDTLCLAVNRVGDPMICGYRVAWLGDFVGWSRHIGPDPTE